MLFRRAEEVWHVTQNPQQHIADGKSDSFITSKNTRFLMCSQRENKKPFELRLRKELSVSLQMYSHQYRE